MPKLSISPVKKDDGLAWENFSAKPSVARFRFDSLEHLIAAVRDNNSSIGRALSGRLKQLGESRILVPGSVITMVSKYMRACGVEVLPNPSDAGQNSKERPISGQSKGQAAKAALPMPTTESTRETPPAKSIIGTATRTNIMMTPILALALQLEQLPIKDDARQALEKISKDEEARQHIKRQPDLERILEAVKIVVQGIDSLANLK